MDERPAYELRILSGMHAGARAPLDGSDYLLGTLDECDFVLMDPGVHPRHARIAASDGGWDLRWAVEEGAEALLAPMRMEPGKAVPLGPVVLSVDVVDAPWPTLEQLVLVPQAAAVEPSLPAPLDIPEGSVPVMMVPRRASVARSVAAWTLTLATAGVSAMALIAWPMGAAHERRQPATIETPAAAAAEKGSLPFAPQKQAIDTALRDLGLTERAKVEPSATGWTVRAGVMSDVESESLSAALSRIQPLPGLRMTTEQDLRADVADMILRMAPEYRGTIGLRYLGEGRFRVEGRMGNAAERDKLLRTLASAFPLVRAWENAVVAAEEAGDRFVAELRSRGSWHVSRAPGAGLLDLQVRLSQRDVPQWEQALLSVAQANPTPFRATLEFVQAQASRESRPPFRVRSVVGGEMPYVLLEEGEKLAPGGVFQGWRLASVGAQQLVFENGAQRAYVPR